MEKQIVLGNNKIPPFLFAYRELCRALAEKDKEALKALLEPSFYKNFTAVIKSIEKEGGELRYQGLITPIGSYKITLR